MYARQDPSHRGVAADFSRKHPDKHPITNATDGKVFKRFRETGSMLDLQCRLLFKILGFA